MTMLKKSLKTKINLKCQKTKRGKKYKADRGTQMTVADKIRNYSDQELADFVYSIYLTGKIEKDMFDKIKTFNEEVDVIEWLKRKTE